MSDDSGTVAALEARIEELEQMVGEITIDRDAYKSASQSLRKIIDLEMKRGEPCRLCGRERTHSKHCYALSGTGYDLLEEHEATLRENAELRQALAVHLPVNGAQILSGATYESHRSRLRRRLKNNRPE